jgi:hypothetical protein
MRRRLLATFISCVVLVTAAGIVWAGEAKEKIYTGKVGDALCRREHSMPVSAVECIRQCIGKGSRYSLIVGDKVYALDTDKQEFLDVLEKQSDARVEVRGTENENGTMIVVKSVKALPQ